MKNAKDIQEKQPIVGINLPGTSDPELLKKRLSTFQEDGFDAVEICLDSFPLIIDGEPCEPWIAYLEKLIQEFPFRYSAHIGRGLDLRDLPRLLKHRLVLQHSIDICARLHLSPLVLHYELQSKNQEVEKTFLEEHRKAAQFAADRGVTLVLENIEVELVEPVIEAVASIDSPNLRLAFDTGHAFLAAHYFKFNFLESFQKVLPFLGHLHLSDNTGVFEELRITDRPTYDSLPMGWRYEYGRGDIHLPPYWGKIPYDELFKLAKNYEGMYICEYYSERFLPFNAQIQQKVRTQIVKNR
ncbi:MAG: sugar phosphate isomerase/epimerase family protein [Spirochaetales bacterium]